jgi:hypothetical protein
VRMFNPKALNDAYASARTQEECIVINKKYGKPVWGSFRNQEVGKEEDRVQKWGKTVTLAYHGQQVGRHQEEIKSPSNDTVKIQEKFKKGAEKCDQTKEIKNTDKLEQEKEETENNMVQETNPAEDTHHLFDQMIQPNQKELSLSESIEVKVIPNSICSTNFLKKFCPFTTKFLKKFQHNGKIFHDEDYMFDKMLESKIVLMRDMCWDYEWGLR